MHSSMSFFSLLVISFFIHPMGKEPAKAPMSLIGYLSTVAPKDGHGNLLRIDPSQQKINEIPVLKSWDSITQLDLDGHTVSYFTIKNIRALFPNLTYLSLARNDIKNISLEQLEGMPDGMTVNLAGNTIEVDALKALAQVASNNCTINFPGAAIQPAVFQEKGFVQERTCGSSSTRTALLSYLSAMAGASGGLALNHFVMSLLEKNTEQASANDTQPAAHLTRFLGFVFFTSSSALIGFHGPRIAKKIWRKMDRHNFYSVKLVTGNQNWLRLKETPLITRFWKAIFNLSDE